MKELSGRIDSPWYMDLERRDLHLSGKKKTYFINLIASELEDAGLTGKELLSLIYIELRKLNAYMAELVGDELSDEDVDD